ncbi:FAD-dependent oxidoreductase, partial [uncultured Parasutterella sp.]
MRRRNLLSLGASLALGAVTTSAAAASPFGIRLWDVVIVGSGLAGLSAAVSARENGAENVLVIEKLPILGGHSRVASGSFCAVSEKRLKPYGIKTTVEDAVKESLVIGGPE